MGDNVDAHGMEEKNINHVRVTKPPSIAAAQEHYKNIVGIREDTNNGENEGESNNLDA